MALDRAAIVRVHRAFVEGDFETLRSELEHLGDFANTAPDLTLGHPLVYAIYHSPATLVAKLLAAGADPDGHSEDGYPPLIAAMTVAGPAGSPARARTAELVEMLLAGGADVNQRGINDYSPLHHAAAQGDLGLVERLLESGADPNLAARIDDMETPFGLALQQGHLDVATRLQPLTTRLDWEQAAKNGDVQTLRAMLRRGQNIDALDGFGSTALMRAAHAGREEAVGLLVAEGAGLDHTAKFHLSALMLAVIAGHRRVARLLVRAGADLTIQGSGAPGFAGQDAADLAEQTGDSRLAAYIRNHRA